jgi:hypothetical protein
MEQGQILLDQTQLLLGRFGFRPRVRWTCWNSAGWQGAHHSIAWPFWATKFVAGQRSGTLHRLSTVGTSSIGKAGVGSFDMFSQAFLRGKCSWALGTFVWQQRVKGSFHSDKKRKRINEQVLFKLRDREIAVPVGTGLWCWGGRVDAGKDTGGLAWSG